MIPVVQDVSKHVTTGMKLDHATSPALQGVTAQQISFFTEEDASSQSCAHSGDIHSLFSVDTNAGAH